MNKNVILSDKILNIVDYYEDEILNKMKNELSNKTYDENDYSGKMNDEYKFIVDNIDKYKYTVNEIKGAVSEYINECWDINLDYTILLMRRNKVNEVDILKFIIVDSLRRAMYDFKFDVQRVISNEYDCTNISNLKIKYESFIMIYLRFICNEIIK